MLTNCKFSSAVTLNICFSLFCFSFLFLSLLLLLFFLFFFFSFQLTLNRKVEISGVTVFGINCQSKSVRFVLKYKTGDSYKQSEV